MVGNIQGPQATPMKGQMQVEISNLSMRKESSHAMCLNTAQGVSRADNET